LDRTHDPALRSWITVAQDSDFPIQNLPFGVFRPPGSSPRIGVAIGDQVLDLAALHRAGKFAGTKVLANNVFEREALNDFMGLGSEAWRAVRARLSRLLEADEPELRDDAGLRAECLYSRLSVEMLLPARVGDYTDFYSSLHHATNMGAMFRDPANPLLPNWRHMPVGYNGRTSSIVVSGTPVRRPCGQMKPDDVETPVFGPSRVLDIELEVGFLTGPGNELGSPIPIGEARDHIFGLVLVNDWSARDIQKWEYVPLGPFLGKSFATSVSPWVVTLDALEPFRVPAPPQEPEVLPYLKRGHEGAYDIDLEVWLEARVGEAARVSATNFRDMYWTMFQQLAHQTVNGTNMRPGDLYASGTVSGVEPGTQGSLLELTWKGTKPLALPGGVMRTFLEDGDTVILRGASKGKAYRVGFGECRGTILPSRC
jgi:fumarylacetoacetase